MKEANEDFSEADIDIMSSKMREAAHGAQDLMRGKTRKIAEKTVGQLIERAVFILKVFSSEFLFALSRRSPCARSAFPSTPRCKCSRRSASRRVFRLAVRSGSISR